MIFPRKTEEMETITRKHPFFPPSLHALEAKRAINDKSTNKKLKWKAKATHPYKLVS